MRHIIECLALPNRAPKENAHGSEDTAGHKDQNASPDFNSEWSESKAFSSLRARYALRGYSLFELAGGSYLVGRWNYSRHLPDMHAAVRFYRQIGGTDV